MSVIHIIGDPGDVEVWLNVDGGDQPADGIVIGVGADAIDALDDAELDLIHALERVRELRAQRQAGATEIEHGG